MQLAHRHRDTLEQIFEHPSSGNVEWRRVRSLLDAVSTTVEERNGKLRVSLGGETEVITPPHGKDVDVQLLVDLRRMLTKAGLGPDTANRYPTAASEVSLATQPAQRGEAPDRG